VRLLQDGDNEEAKYIVRWLQKTLKTGAAEKTMISALARAMVYTPPNLIMTKKENLNSKVSMGEESFVDECARIEHAIKEAACESPNYGAIINCMLKSGTDTDALRAACHMKVGTPLKPMLANPTKGVQIILKRFEGIDFTCEYKYDGFRG
jgi:DNA ligase-1